MRFLAKDASVVPVAKADDCKGCTFVSEGLFFVAQLRDMLATENSAVVAQENDDGSFAFPK